MSDTAETKLVLVNNSLENKVDDILNKSTPTDQEEDVKTNQVFVDAVKLHILTVICHKDTSIL